MAKSSPLRKDRTDTDRAKIKRLWQSYIRPQKRRLLLAILFMVILAAATAAYTFVVNYIINQAGALDDGGDAVSNARAYAFAVLPVLLSITLVSGISNYAQRILCNSVALNAVGQLQKQMFDSAHNRDFMAFSREPIGNLISKFTNDVTVISNALLRALSNLIKDLLTIVFVVCAMLYQNWQLTALILLFYPLAAWPIIMISKRLRGNAKDVQEHVGKITSDLKESFGGARMIKAYGLETQEKDRLGYTFDERIRLFLKLVSEHARVDPILEVFGGLAIAGVVIFGVYQVTGGAASAGSIAGVLTGLLLLSPAIRALGTLNNVVQEGLAALSRIFAVIDERPTITDAPNAAILAKPQGHVTFKDVSFTYPGGSEAVKDINITANAGETIALVGPSGGGKSTLINLVPRLFDVTGGAVLVDGQDIRGLTLESLRANMALVSQDVTLFHDSIANNIGFGDPSAGRGDIENAARAADAHDFIMALPAGYDTVLSEDGDSLSGGQKQRLSIARAILRDAPILLLDEATSALDAQSEAKVQAALEKLSNGRTTLVIAHRLSTVQTADKIYVLENGRVTETGIHKSLIKKRGGIYANLWALQAG